MHDVDDAAGAERVAALEQQLEEVLRERNALWADAQRMRSLEAEVKHARAIIADMNDSLSWRVTTPLRTLKGRGVAHKKLAGRVRRAVRGG